VAPKPTAAKGRNWPQSNVRNVSFSISARYFLVSKKERQHAAGAHRFVTLTGRASHRDAPGAFASDRVQRCQVTLDSFFQH